MRPLMVVERAPVVEGALAVGEIAKTAPADHFGLEGAMEALFLALGLGMAGPAVHDAHAKPGEPDAEAGQRLAARIAPRRTAVHQHGERQAIAAKGLFQMAAHRLALLISTGREHQIVAGMVVERSQRMAASAVYAEVTLEVHLP